VFSPWIAGPGLPPAMAPRRATIVYNLDQTQMRGLLVRPLGMSSHLEKPPVFSS
jgi:hypothetical protein